PVVDAQHAVDAHRVHRGLAAVADPLADRVAETRAQSVVHPSASRASASASTMRYTSRSGRLRSVAIRRQTSYSGATRGGCPGSRFTFTDAGPRLDSNAM